MPDCMKNLRTTGMEEAVRDAIRNKPFFAVCVGEQMLFEHSEEGDTPGWAFSRATSFALLPTVWTNWRTPQSSSDGLEPGDADREHPMWNGITNGAWFYLFTAITPNRQKQT